MARYVGDALTTFGELILVVQKCQSQAWSQYHRLECKLYSKLHPRVLPATVRAVIRLLRQHKAELLPEGEWEQLLALESHQDDLAKSESRRWQDLLIMMQGIKGYSETEHSPDLILRLICVLTVNSFTLTSATFDSIGMILHPKPALMNHSCNPNAYVRFDVSSPSYGFPPCGSISVHALQDIGKDEEITISYVDTTFPSEKRQQELKQRYFFDCRCDLCVKGHDTPQDNYHLPPGCSPDAPVSVSLVESGNRAEQFFLRIQATAGSEHEHLDEIRAAMDQLAKTGAWPLHRYPWPQLRQQLLYGLLGSRNFSEAFLQSAVFVRVIHPVLFEQEYHPIRLVQLWTFWILGRQCLEILMQKAEPSDRDHRHIRALGLVSCVVIDHVHHISSRGSQPKGRLERMVDEALQNVQREGAFWMEYWRDRAENRKAAWSWVDNQVEALLKAEGVSPGIIKQSLPRVQG